MRYFLLLFFCLPLLAMAASQQTMSDTPFATEVISQPAEAQFFYGELTSWPHTFSFVVTETIPFKAQLAVAPEGNQQSSLIVIKEAKRGVTEVDRRTGKNEAWQPMAEPMSGLAFTQSRALAATLTPGVYRLEVSAPDNTGTYLLQLGEGQPAGGYFTRLGYIVQLHSFFGVGWVGVVTSRYVLWPFFIIALILAGLWYRYIKV